MVAADGGLSATRELEGAMRLAVSVGSTMVKPRARQTLAPARSRLRRFSAGGGSFDSAAALGVAPVAVEVAVVAGVFITGASRWGVDGGGPNRPAEMGRGGVVRGRVVRMS